MQRIFLTYRQLKLYSGRYMTPDYDSRTTKMYNPPNDYRRKTNWSEAEDKALITVFGLTSIEEICEAYMCSPFCIISRARILGIMPPKHSLITAQDIEWMIRLLETGVSDDDLAEKFGLPDHSFKYIMPRYGALSACRREVQDFYAKQNDDQLDMFTQTELDK